jgi:hypothetical protein
LSSPLLPANATAGIAQNIAGATGIVDYLGHASLVGWIYKRAHF